MKSRKSPSVMMANICWTRIIDSCVPDDGFGYKLNMQCVLSIAFQKGSQLVVEKSFTLKIM